MQTIWLGGAEWVAVLRIGIGLWWLESWRHKDKKTWFGGGGIGWAAGIAEKHRWSAVREGFNVVVKPRPRVMAYVVAYAELALGLGLIVGFLTPVALICGFVLNLVYLVLMIHDWAEQGQNLMMALASFVAFFAMSWQAWSLDDALGMFV
ncbi:MULTISPECIES: DoxX family membrane protein [unclassified Streptomyces]|uniref:DoxX family membrane protein n=1 Tax=unclassified Streptomyces TaxID=2593676 RepID=UPI0022866AC6|nr:DoxX family membrane protein [Streptomyces sp. Je 1-369]WAL96886.1 DoxX family membrane protein [Streptomyces sp. Je 1-369]